MCEAQPLNSPRSINLVDSVGLWLYFKDEADHHKDDGDEDHVDLVSKAEQQFFECIEVEKNRREREGSRKDHGLYDDEEKHDRGKVCYRSVSLVYQKGSHGRVSHDKSG